MLYIFKIFGEIHGFLNFCEMHVGENLAFLTTFWWLHGTTQKYEVPPPLYKHINGGSPTSIRINMQLGAMPSRQLRAICIWAPLLEVHPHTL